jgi:tetratricopeptide (TPR) repeat protein
MPQHPISHRAQPIRPIKSAGWRLTPLLVCIGLPLASWAQTGELSLNPNPDRKGTATSSGSALPLESFKYIAPAGAGKTQQALEAIKRTPEQQRILDFNTAGNYQAAGTEGLALMSKEKLDDDLQLIVANSLAWTGRMKEAIPTYQGLAKGKYANEANVGVANVFRWNGREDQAAPLYRAVLANDPENKDAIEGLELAGRELRPRTTVSFGGSSDSSDIQRRAVTVNHRWRDGTGSNVMEIETSAVRDTLPTFQARQQDLTFRYQALNLALKPSFEISSATKTNGNVFASGRINLFDDKLSLQA